MTKSFDVILINTVENLGVYPPLSLCYLQAVLESDKCGNLVTNLLDAGKYGIDKSNVDAVAKMVSKRTPYIVGISSMDTELKVGIHLSKKLKEIDPDIVVCMGGYGSTFQPERCLEKGKCDFVVRGEGELTVGELFPRIIAGEYGAIYKSRGVSYKKDGKIISTPDQDLVYELDDLPFPERRDLYKDYTVPPIYFKDTRSNRKKRLDSIRNYLFDYEALRVNNTPVMSSRGCSWGKCDFCSGAKFPGGDNYRVRSNESIMKELRKVNDEYGLGVVTDYSSGFLANDPERTENFLGQFCNDFEDAYLAFMIRPDSFLKSREPIEKYLKNIHLMSIGVENFSDEFLRRNKKGVTSQINQKAILAMQDLRKKRGDEGICYPTFYIPMTIDCDNKTTFKEFKEHYSLIKKLGLLELWEPNFMKYHPIRSWEEQEYLSRKDVHSGNENGRYDLEPFLLRDIIKNIEASPELHIVATGFKDDAMKERAEKLKRIFDPLVESI